MEDTFTMKIEKGARLSNSPANSPRVVSGRASPAKSEEGEMEQGLQSINRQEDMGMRTTDFFDDTSDTASDPARSAGFSHTAENGGSEEKKSSTTAYKKLHSKGRPANETEQNRDAPSKKPSRDSRLHPFLRLTSGYGAHHVGPSVFEHTESSSGGSVDELSTAESRQLYHQFPGIGRSIQQDPSPRTSAAVDDNDLKTSRNSKNDRFLSAHAITMQALLRDERLGRDIMSPLTEEPRTSDLFASLGHRLEDKTETSNTHGRKRSKSAPARKRVSLIPPPININSPKRTLPEDIVRTPYPFLNRKDPILLREDSILKSSPTHSAHESSHYPNRNYNFNLDTTDCVLTLSIRRANPSRAPPRISRLVIPSTSNDFRSVRHSTVNVREKHFDGLGFDDAELFRCMRDEYAKLAGPGRFFSARVLKRMAVVAGDDVCSGDGGNPPCRRPSSTNGSSNNDNPYRHVPSLRSPRLVAHSGLSDTFSEHKLLLHFHSRMMGKARYAWVHWARRLASCPARTNPYEPFQPHRPAPVPPLPPRHPDHRHPPNWPLTDNGVGSGPDPHSGPRDSGVEVDELEREVEQYEPAGLEFVPGWAVGRIVAAVVVVIFLAVVAAMLWTLLGLPRKDLETLPGYGDTGFRGAGGRVETGCVLGVLVLIVGWTGIAGWVWLSWAIM